jgi:hypothetical protein
MLYILVFWQILQLPTPDSPCIVQPQVTLWLMVIQSILVSSPIWNPWSVFTVSFLTFTVFVVTHTLSDKRLSLLFVGSLGLCHIFIVLTIFHMYSIHRKLCYIYTVCTIHTRLLSVLVLYRSYLILPFLHCDGIVVTWTVISLTTTKFKLL